MVRRSLRWSLLALACGFFLFESGLALPPMASSSPSRLLVLFQPDMTNQLVEPLLQRARVRLVDRVPFLNLQIVEPANGHAAEMGQLVPLLESDPRVLWIAPDALLSSAVISAPSSAEDPFVLDSSSNTPSGLDPNHWIWEPPADLGRIKPTGNWGLHALRIPQMWNLNDAVRHRANPVWTGIMDAGFQDKDGDGRDDHPDLGQLQTLLYSPEDETLRAGAAVGAHGQHVAGIIGATFNNGLGIDGVNPFARMIGVSPQLSKGSQEVSVAWSVFVTALSRLLETHPEVRVVNVSLSYNWAVNTRLKVDPNTDKEIQRLVQQQGVLMRLLAAKYPEVLFVSAAGNDSYDRFGYPHEIQAQWASPLNWAALGPAFQLPNATDSDHPELKPSPNILVIESFDDILPGESNYRRSDFSNVGGELSAPGGRIMSTVLNDKYDTFDGTSMAAPHVTGLAGYLLAFDPTLTVKEIKQLLLETSRPVDEESGDKRGPQGERPAPRIDVFSALLTLDSLRSGKPVQRALVDVDDCTPDGNQRLDAQGHELDTLCPGGLRGDNNVDMRDFRAFRDALLYVEGWYRVDLDGPANSGKKDLNGDGCVHEADPVGCPVDENIYPRFDFNGDGIVSGEAKANFKRQVKTDLEVLMDVWGSGPNPDTEGWTISDLPQLLDSGGLHFDLSKMISSQALDRVIVMVSETPIPRVATKARPELVITAPAFKPLEIKVQGIRAGIIVIRQCATVPPLQPGQDVHVELARCE